MDKFTDLPSCQKMNSQVEGLDLLLDVFPQLNKDNANLRQELQRIKSEYYSIFENAEKFNTYFLDRGWCSYGLLSSDLVQQCVKLGDAGNLDEAERKLVDYYKSEDIHYLVAILRSIAGFKERYDLFCAAYEDFKAGRYHACVPVFLMIVDGAVDRVIGQHSGLFSQNTDLELWDSMIGHQNGLIRLIKLITRFRNKNNSEPIYIPYRNGILHGKDLNYANEFVASKSLALVFAVADWIREFNDVRHKKPESKLEKSLLQNLEEAWKAFECYKKANKQRAEDEIRINNWIPRDFTNEGFVDFLPVADTPEEKVVEYLNWWQKANYGKIAEILSTYQDEPIGKVAGFVRSQLKDYQLGTFSVQGIEDQSPAISEVKVNITVSFNEVKHIPCQLNFRLICQSTRSGFNAVPRDSPTGRWYILDLVLSQVSGEVVKFFQQCNKEDIC